MRVPCQLLTGALPLPALRQLPPSCFPFCLVTFGTACLMCSCLLDPCIQAHSQPGHEVAHECSSGLVAALLLLHWHWSELLRAGKKTLLRSHASGDAERGERLPLLDETPLLASHSPRQALALLCLQIQCTAESFSIHIP